MSSIREGRVIAARYQLERLLASGGMGSVWVARHLLLESTLAIKFIESRLAEHPEARGRFEREAKVAAQLQGPNLVQIHDYGIDDGTPYMVMEYLRGEDLSSRLNREKRLSLQATADIVTQVARVLRRAHEAGIIHRDLKPGNVFLVSNEDIEIVKVLDFGLAKIPRANLPEDITKTGTLLGSPRYMSPEQARAMKNIDHRCDLWSLAVIAFRAITGALPFPGDEIADVLVKICAEPAPVPSSIDPALSPAIDRFFERAFAPDANRRFQSARELATAFAAATGGQTTSSSTTPVLGDDAPRIVAPNAEPEPVEITRKSAVPPPDARTRPAADDHGTSARPSWPGIPSESPAGLHLSALPPSSPRFPRRARLTAGALALALASAFVIVHVTFTKGSNHEAPTPAATPILAEPTPERPTAPTVIPQAVLPSAPIPAITPAPVPTIRRAAPGPAGTTSARTPSSAPKPPSTKRKNPILGI